MDISKEKNIRFKILTYLIMLIGALLIFQLAKLQLINGEEYRAASQKRLFRQALVKAPRGEIFDRNGKLLVTNREAFNVEILKISIEPERLNRVLLSVIKIFEVNGDSYIDNFPMSINPYKFEFGESGSSNDEKLKEFKSRFKIKENNLSNEQIFKEIRKYYNIPAEFSATDARKVIALRYEISQKSISQFDPVVIAYDISKQTVAKLEERHLDFPGVSVIVEPIRSYPNGPLASHLLGYIGKINQREFEKLKAKGYDRNDIIGKDGIESILEGFLKGTAGLKRVEMDSLGRLTGEVSTTPPEAGKNIYLTIDMDLQKMAEKSLQETISKVNQGGYKDKFEDAKSGSVVAIDVKTGEILALANYPSYDPAMFVKGISSTDWKMLMDNEQRPMYNRAIAGIYSPGSTFKMVTAMAALSEGKTTINEEIQDKGEYTRYKYNGKAPACWIWNSEHRTHGYVNVSEALKVSCNYFFYEMGYRTGIDNLNKYVKMFGLGQKTGVELPGEKAGIIAGPEYKKLYGNQWYPGDTLSAAIGQSDYSFTPIQMANYIATLVNGGIRNRPHLVSKITTWDGQQVADTDIKKELTTKLGEDINKPAEQLSLNKGYIDAVFKGMESVTGDAGGTAYSTFSNFPIRVAGKTGTVQVKGKYKNGKKMSDHAWFVGFAPYDNPQIGVAVIIEHGGHGSYTAPVARDIIGQYFGLFKEQEKQSENTSINKKTSKKKSKTKKPETGTNSESNNGANAAQTGTTQLDNNKENNNNENKNSENKNNEKQTQKQNKVNKPDNTVQTEQIDQQLIPEDQQQEELPQ